MARASAKAPAWAGELLRRDAAHDVAIDIAAGGNRIEQRGVDGFKSGF